MKRTEYNHLTTTHKQSNLILFCCFVVAGLLNYYFITHLKTKNASVMNIQETTTYELTETEVRVAIHYAFTQKLKDLNKNAFFDTHNIIIEGYENRALARLILTENSEI